MKSPVRPTEPTVIVGLAGQLLGPAGEVEVGAFELRLPEAALRAVEDVGAGVDQRLEPGFHAPGVSASLAAKSCCFHCERRMITG